MLVADAGANVLLLSPYDPVVFERTWPEEGLVFSALSQLVADLLTSPGRGPSEGEELLRWMGEHVSVGVHGARVDHGRIGVEQRRIMGRELYLAISQLPCGPGTFSTVVIA